MTVQLSAEQVLDEHPQATVLSVDFFDTLITRSVAQPTHVFAMMEQDLIAARGDFWRGFAVARVEAEQRARHNAASENEYRDVTFDEIGLHLARQLALNTSDRDMVMALERDTELQLVQVVPFGAGITEAARSRGMRVVIVSDNYMPATHLLQMAHRAGYSWMTEADIFVSCEHGGMKHNGMLWPVVLSALNVPAGSILHVGDDERADGEMPTSLGIATHVRDTMRTSHRDMLNTTPAVLPLSRVEAQYRNAIDDTHWDVAEVVGGGLVAMIVAAQIIDAHFVVGHRSVAGVHFAARDGYLAHQVWNTLRSRGWELPEATYTAFSRSVVWRACLSELTRDNVGRFVGDDEVLTVSRLERRVGCALNTELDRELSIDASTARDIVLKNTEAVLSACKSLRARLLKYLQSHEVLMAGHHIVVDLGWTGSTIADLAELVASESGDLAVLEGRLTGLYWDATPQRMRIAMHGFAMDEFGSTDDNVRLLGVIKLLEALVTAPHGSVVDYEEDGTPVFVETAPERRAYENVMRQVGDAAVRGALAILDGTHPSGITAADITKETVWAAIMQVGHSPRADEIELLSHVNHVTSIDHEGEGRPLIAVKPTEPSKVSLDHLSGMYDMLIHRHWMQGSLRALANNADSRWIADEMYKLHTMTSPRWVK
jgi:FMN phosphatase YigB (HAD superfamily)